MSQLLYKHYRFSQDKDNLRQIAYPLMKSAAESYLEWLVEKDGYPVTVPSTSPENSYMLTNGSKEVIIIGSTMDMPIISNLFTNITDVDSILRIEAKFAALLKEKRARLYPLHIGRKGSLQEWYAFDFQHNLCE